MATRAWTELAAEAAWVRGRARHMARDVHAADDLAQEAFLAALVSPPRVGKSLRAWLVSVMRNALRQDARAQVRRRQREHAAARPVAVGPTSEGEALRELLAETLARLEEPFRTALELRYHEGLAIPEIARRTAVPVDTVRSRLRRGLARMRRRLARELHGEDRRFLAALLAPLGRPGSMPTLGWLVMNVKWIAAAALCVVAAVWLVPQLLGPSSPGRSSPTVAADELDRPDELVGVEPGAVDETGVAEAGRAAVPTETMPATGATDEPAAAISRRAWVLGADGAPIAGVRTVFVDSAGDRSSGVSAADGAITIELLPGRDGVLRCDDERFATILEGELESGQGVEPVLVVAPAVDLAGVVVDPTGEPLAGAAVRLRMPAGYQRRFVHVLDASVEREFVERTRGAGGFSLVHVPAVEGASLSVEKPGFAGVELAAPLASDASLRVVLEPRSPGSGDLLGRVVDAEGRPVPGARVAAAGEVIRTDANGEFVFAPEVRARAREVVAVQAGHLPGRATAVGGADGPVWPDYLELRLGGAPLEILGHVVDDDGEPLEGIRVWVADPTHFGVEDETPVQLEGLAAGALSRSDVEESGATIRGHSTTFWCFDETDAEGRFRLEGLSPRAYHVKAMEMDALLYTEREGVRAGAREIELVLPLRRGGHRVAGVIRSASGGVVAGATVGAFHRAYGVEYGEDTTTVWDVSGPETRTDEQGRFTFPSLPADLWLYVSGEDVAGKAYFVQPEDDLEDLEITVERIDTEVAHFRIELTDPERADAFELRNADGATKEVALIRGGSRVTFHRPDLVAGSSYVYAVREGRYELVLFVQDREVEREWFTLSAGEVITLRP